MYICRLLSWVYSKTINLSFNGILDVRNIGLAILFYISFQSEFDGTYYIRGDNKGS